MVFVNCSRRAASIPRYILLSDLGGRSVRFVFAVPSAPNHIHFLKRSLIAKGSDILKFSKYFTKTLVDVRLHGMRWFNYSTLVGERN